MTPLHSPLLAGRPNGIIEVAAAALSNPRPIRMWFGESDLGTPEPIADAAVAALRAGQTFYAPRRGIPELRAAIAAYLGRHCGVALDVERVTVTASGMNAIMVALQATVDAGANVVVVSPIWPNVINAVLAVGAECREVRLRRRAGDWLLDLDALFDAVDDRTRAIFIASPGNPTGWICEAAEQAAILDFCRRRNIHLIADEVYQRIVYDRDVAPSFLTLDAAGDAPLFVVNSFSKNWAMSGWRLGWLVHPSHAAPLIGELNAVNNTGAATFVQHAGVEAIKNGEPFVERLRRYCARGRAIVAAGLADIPRAAAGHPAGAMYSFFSIDGIDDDLAFARRLAGATGVGLAPGSAFGAGNEGFFRLCFALDETTLRDAMHRLHDFLADAG